MKTTALLGTAVTLLSLTLPATAATYQYQYRGDNAYASFYEYGVCSSKYVSVSAYDNVNKDGPGAPTSQKGAYIYYSDYNYCTGQGSAGYGWSDNANFSASQTNSAILTGSFNVYDYWTGNSKTINVNLSWNGTGDVYRGNSHSHYQGPGYSSNSRSNGSSREAQVLGSVTVDGTNIINGLSGYGSLSTTNNGSLYITTK